MVLWGGLVVLMLTLMLEMVIRVVHGRRGVLTVIKYATTDCGDHVCENRRLDSMVEGN